MSNNLTPLYVGGDISEGSKDHFRGIVKTGCNDLTLIPYAADHVIRHDMTDDSQTCVNIAGITQGQYKKFVGGAVGSTGMIYGGPHDETSALTVDSSMSCFACSVGRVTPTQPDVTAADQSRGPVTNAIGSKIYTPAYSGNGNEKWNVIDVDYNSEETSIPWSTIPRTAPVYTDRPAWNTGPTPWIYSSIYGGVDAGNGKIYGAPFGSPHLNILNTAFGTSYWGSDVITGNAPTNVSNTENIPAGLAYKYTFLSKYIGGALADNGHVYMHGHKARSILKINVNTDDVTEIPYPTEIINAMVGKTVTFTSGPEGEYVTNSALTKHAASVGSVKAANGMIYNIPRGVPYIIWIDPSDDSIGYKNIKAALNFGSGADSSWYGAGVAAGNSIYYAPERAKKVLRIDL